jgi:hypothetical protein
LQVARNVAAAVRAAPLPAWPVDHQSDIAWLWRRLSANSAAFKGTG